MGLTFRHALDARNRRKAFNIQKGDFFDVQRGMVTVQYPKEAIPVPDNGRYRLHNEMDDCIVCDKCAKVCPVDCIEIEPIKATGEVGRASDGSVIRLYAAKFDIDMAKCCYCGLCTTVCPTECLTMTKTFDYSEFDVREMVYAYGNLSPEEARQKRELLEQFQMEKAMAKGQAAKPAVAATSAPKPAFKPSLKPNKTADNTSMTAKPVETTYSTAKFHPKNWDPAHVEGVKNLSFTYNPDSLKPQKSTDDIVSGSGFKPTVKPADATGSRAFRPTMRPKGAANKPAETPAQETQGHEASAPKPAFRPTMKPKGAADKPAESSAQETQASEASAPKPAFRPTMRPKGAADKPAETPAQETQAGETSAPKPAFRPTMKPKGAADKPAETPAQETQAGETPASKPAFRPTMKPASSSTKPTFQPTLKSKPVVEMDEDEEPIVQKLTENFKPHFHPADYKPTAATFRPSFRKPDVQGVRPIVNVKSVPSEEAETKPAVEKNDTTEDKPRPAFRPTMKPRK